MHKNTKSLTLTHGVTSALVGAATALALAVPFASASQAATGEMSAAAAGQTLDDAAITTKVKAALLMDEKTKSTAIHVDTREGVVTLTGKVRDIDARRHAVHVVQGVSCVRRVDDQLTLASTAGVSASEQIAHAADKAGDAVADSVITAKVKAALLAAPDLKSMRINVSTRHGVVVLAGLLPSQRQFDEAVTTTQEVGGVKSINTHALRVGKS
ncbi:MAG: BON domain-containing protein [Pseudomonadota bacterium]